MAEGEQGVLRETTAAVIAEAREMIRAADHAALATIEAGTGHPLASRVGLATLADGTPLIVVSGLAAHSAALDGEPRCSLLIGETGKGDPLAHPRLTLMCRAALVAPDGRADARARYLAQHAKAAIYVDLPDFRFFRLSIERASFNAGFGRAYAIAGGALVG